MKILVLGAQKELVAPPQHKISSISGISFKFTPPCQFSRAYEGGINWTILRDLKKVPPKDAVSFSIERGRNHVLDTIFWTFFTFRYKKWNLLARVTFRWSSDVSDVKVFMLDSKWTTNCDRVRKRFDHRALRALACQCGSSYNFERGMLSKTKEWTQICKCAVPFCRCACNADSKMFQNSFEERWRILKPSRIV